MRYNSSSYPSKSSPTTSEQTLQSASRQRMQRYFVSRLHKVHLVDMLSVRRDQDYHLAG